MPHSRALFDTQEWALIATKALLAEAGHLFVQIGLSHFVERAPFFDGHIGGQAALYEPGPRVAPCGVSVDRYR